MKIDVAAKRDERQKQIHEEFNHLQSEMEANATARRKPLSRLKNVLKHRFTSGYLLFTSDPPFHLAPSNSSAFDPKCVDKTLSALFERFLAGELPYTYSIVTKSYHIDPVTACLWVLYSSNNALMLANCESVAI